MKVRFVLVLMLLVGFILYGCANQKSEAQNAVKNFLKASYEKDYDGIRKFVDFDDILKQMGQETGEVIDNELKKAVIDEIIKEVCKISKGDYEKGISSLSVEIDKNDSRYATAAYSTTLKSNVALRLEKRKTGWIIIRIG
ncbi:MAG: hypothetical protein M1147_04080 [Nitrospirae bacterium]|nr:hypothetical protein [Nitrospirota bacterium]MCL5977294.1 hypothetical protein [Nitrospirota bacterium]